MRVDLLSLLLTTAWQGSLAVAAVLLLCLVLRRTNVSRRLNCLLWAVALLRLYWPGSIHLPLPQKSTPPIVMTVVQMGEMAAPHLNPLEPTSNGLTEMSLLWRKALLGLWFLGLAVMLCRTLAEKIGLNRKLKNAGARGGFCTLPGLKNAFVTGLIHPRICLPEGLTQEQEQVILLHERTHIRRADHWRKALWWLAVCLHWWNPLVWLGFREMNRDMEIACDEAALKNGDGEIRACYCQSLLNMAWQQESFCSPGFGSDEVKERISRILAGRRPALWASAAALVLCVCVATALMVRPMAEEVPPNMAGPSETAAPEELPDRKNPVEAIAPEPEQEIAEEAPPVEAEGEESSSPVGNAWTENVSTVPETSEAAIIVDTDGISGDFLWPVPAVDFISRVMDDEHRGTDIVAEKGSDILAMADGVVAVANENHYSYGNHVVIDHIINGENYRSLYAHCDTLRVKAGDTVMQGQLIATVGSTGDADGNICHVELTCNGVRTSIVRYPWESKQGFPIEPQSLSTRNLYEAEEAPSR